MVATALADLEPGPLAVFERITVHSDYRLKDAVKAVPGSKWHNDLSVWSVPLTWPACLALRAQLGAALTIGPALREWATTTKAAKERAIEMRSQLELIEGIPYTSSLPGFDALFPHQLVGAEIVRQTRRYLVTDETGCGKSRVPLAGFALLWYDDVPIFPLVIVCPKSMCGTWPREVELFFPEADVRVAQGTPSKIKTALDPGGDVYILSWDSLRRYSKLSGYGSIKLSDDEKESKEIQHITPVSVILDEAHRAKNPKAQTTRAAWATTASAKNVVGLTGTPIQESPDDLWSVLYAISPKEYPTRTSYRERYLESKFNQWGQLEIGGVRPDRRDEFFANLDARMRRLSKKAALPFLPDKLVETRWVTLPPKMRKAYLEMETDLIAELESSTVTASSPMERSMRLIQLANASGSVTEEPQPDGTIKLKFHMELPSPKIDAFIEDVKDGDYGDSSIVIFSDSRQLADLLSLEMWRKGLLHLSITGGVTGEDRTKAIDAFQAGSVPYIIITRAGSEGITLTRADVLVRLVRSWSLTVHNQSEDRIHRIGSERHDSIKIVDYLTEDSVEIEQMIRLNGKDARAQEVLRDDELLDMLKARSVARAAGGVR